MGRIGGVLKCRERKRGCKKKKLGDRGRHSPSHRSDLYCTYCKMNGSHEEIDCKVPWENIKEDRKN
jgi:hypothetical protein